VGARRRPNVELRTREHLTPGEVEDLMEAARANRHGHRDATMILLAFQPAQHLGKLRATGGRQLSKLTAQILLSGANPRVADIHHEFPTIFAA
jgi:hypothetical protein